MFSEMQFFDQEPGQAMVEYAIIAGGVAIAFFAFNLTIIPHLNDFYELIAKMLSLPIP